MRAIKHLLKSQSLGFDYDVIFLVFIWSTSIMAKNFIDKGVVLNLPMKHQFADMETKNTPLNPSQRTEHIGADCHFVRKKKSVTRG